MLLSIQEMEVRDLPFDHVWQPGEIDFDDSGTGVIQRGPLTAKGIASLLPGAGGHKVVDVAGDVHIRGTAQADLECPCDRCLATAAFHVEAAFDLYYQPVEAASKAEETAVDEDEAEIAYYEPPGLILEDIAREQILLQLPMQRLCRAECKGICPVCGGNRNEKDCHCEAGTGSRDNRWNALQGLRIPAGPSDTPDQV